MYLPAADGEYLAADLPHIRAAPLHYVSGGGQGSAEFIELVIGHVQILVAMFMIKPWNILENIHW